jgi:hypothetical protein
MKNNKEMKANLELAFDVGHSSIGWAVLQQTGKPEQEVELMGCGAVVFRADDCLASSQGRIEGSGAIFAVRDSGLNG